MGERSIRQPARTAALDAQAGHRRQRQERDRRIDGVSVEVLIALDERDAAERRAGQLLPTMIDRERLSLRQAPTWLDDPITIRSATRPLALVHSDEPRAQADGNGSGVPMSGRGLIRPGRPLNQTLTDQPVLQASVTDADMSSARLASQRLEWPRGSAGE